MDSFVSPRSLTEITSSEPLLSYKVIKDLPAAIYTCDKEGRITFFNEAAAALWGRRPEIGKDLWCGSWRIYYPDGSVLPFQLCPMAIALTEGRTVYGEEIIVERPTGERRVILPHPMPFFDEAGKVSGAINMLVDITRLRNARNALHYINPISEGTDKTIADLETEIELKTASLQHAIEKLRKSEELYHRMIIEVEDYAIYLISKDGIIENWNNGVKKIKGYSADEIVGKNFRIFYTPEDQNKRLPEQLLNEATQQGRAGQEGWRVRKDGTRFWASVVITALHDENKNIIGFSKVTRDLSDKKENEDKLRLYAQELEDKNKELERMNQELSSFAYVSSHDLQEPLRKIQAFASRLEIEKDKLSDKGREYLDRMKDGAQRMQTLIRDLLTYSSTNTFEKETESIDLNFVLSDIKKELEETIHEKEAVIESQTLPKIKGIAFQFHQLIFNLMSNALKFTRAGTTPVIRINADIVESRDIKSDLSDEKKTFHRITITDNGIGFEPEYSHKIFEVFQRLHGKSEYTGTGIGLAICKRIVENHGGLISAEGQINKGASFVIYLPYN